MSKQKQKPQKIRAAALPRSKGNPVTIRTDRTATISATAPNSPIYKAQPEIQSAYSLLVAKGNALATYNTNVMTLEMQLADARGQRDVGIGEFDYAFNIFSTHAENFSENPNDLASLGLTPLSRGIYNVILPDSVSVTFHNARKVIDIHVYLPQGMDSCIVEVSPTPPTPGSWVRLPGIGVIRKASGYAPGTYLVRAASVRGSEESDFTVPVPVIVP